ncbi:hypothetical protein BKA62DRAFT_167030 [Auriculariales sp. MPI-PUGE-AT-0066]|nr:hypothetical protein BKA62DRAFT_167030 [Auriculariales sp. MPI-PUGE-AT-0066]
MKVVRSRIPSYAPLGNSEQHPIIIFDEVEDPLSSSPAVISVHRKRGFQDLCTNNHLAHGRVQRQLKISEFSHHVADFFKLRKEALTACQHLDELRTLLLGISSSTTSLALSGLEQSLVTARSAASLLTVRFPAYTTLVEALLAFFADDDKACAARNRSPFSCTWDTRPESLRPRQKRRFESPRGLLRESGSHPILLFPFNSSTNKPFRPIGSSTSVAISDSILQVTAPPDLAVSLWLVRSRSRRRYRPRLEASANQLLAS